MADLKGTLSESDYMKNFKADLQELIRDCALYLSKHGLSTDYAQVFKGRSGDLYLGLSTAVDQGRIRPEIMTALAFLFFKEMAAIQMRFGDPASGFDEAFAAYNEHKHLID